MFERSGLGAGGHSAAALANAGTIAGDLPKRAGDFVKSAGPSGGGGGGGAMAMGAVKLFMQMAKDNGMSNNATVRQDLVKLHTLHEVGRMLAMRLKAEKSAGRDIPGAANIAKLSMSEIMRQSRDLGLRLAGAGGMLHAYNAADRKQPTTPPANLCWPSSPRWVCSRRRRPSTAAPTRCSATSSANERSAFPRSPTTTAR